ncbi:MAG TPA: type II secretion system protein GspM [Polyangiaceae bacterium]|nr:type II secretion system protein GspM [Polyangiaceae bacterium]
MKRLREWFDGLAERERRLIVVFGAVVGVFCVFIIPYLVSLTLDSRREEVGELRKAIGVVQSAKDKVAGRQHKRDTIAARYGNKAPPLAGFIESAAKSANLAVPESQDLSDLPHGKRFTERSTTIRLRKVGMLALTRMLEKIEASGHPVVISKLHIRKRGGETDSYDVEMNVSAFDTVSTGKDKDARPADSAKPASSGDSR